jgi:hypothetical protein
MIGLRVFEAESQESLCKSTMKITCRISQNIRRVFFEYYFLEKRSSHNLGLLKQIGRI